MAVIAVQDAQAGLASVTRTAATGGGDTIVPGAAAGGWTTGVVLVVQNLNVAARTVTVKGVAYIVPALVGASPGLALIPVHGPDAAPVAVTYSAVVDLTVGAVQIAGK